jgi:hypothetical protein
MQKISIINKLYCSKYFLLHTYKHVYIDLNLFIYPNHLYIYVIKKNFKI